MNDQSPPELMLQARSTTEVTQAPTLAPTRQRSISSPYIQDPDTNNPTLSNRASAAQNASEVPLLDQDREKAKRQGCEKAKLRASSTMLNNKSNSLASLRRLQSGKQKARQCSTVPPNQSPDRSGGEPQVTTRRRHDLRRVKTVPSTRFPTPRLTRRAVSMIPTSFELEDFDPRITPPSVIPPSIESERLVMIEEDMVPNSQIFENSVIIEDKNGQKEGPAKSVTYERLSRTALRPLLTKDPTSPFVQQSAYSSPSLYPVRNVSADTWLQKKETTRIRRYLFKNLPSSPTTEMFIPEGKGPGETLPNKKTVPREGQRQDSARVEDAHEESPLRRGEQLLCNVIEDDVEGESEMVTEFEDKLQKGQARWQFTYAGKPALKGKRCQDLERTDDGDLHSRTSSLVRSQRDIFNLPNDTPDSSSIKNVAPTRLEDQPNPAHTSQVRSIIKPDSAGDNASNDDISFQMTPAQTGGNGNKQKTEARQYPERNRRTHTPRTQERPENGLSRNSGVEPIQTSFYSARENLTQNKGGMITGNVSGPQDDWPSKSTNAGVNDEATRPANHSNRRARRGRKRNRNEGPANAPEAPSIQPFKLATSHYTTKADSHAPAFSQDHLMGDEELNQAMRDAGSYLENGRFDLTKELREVGDDQSES
ncbi:hypothetical protein KEM56_002072 [Ascosphaera pollenicola]|nr:hypothetical protein KEM56_002072 [Ascosphaera pollenicola]